MPNIKSSIKRVAVIERKTAVNKIKRSQLRTSLKKARAAVATSAENTGELLRDAQSRIDKAAAKGYLHKNNAARKQSKLAKAANAANQ
ncbi:MAG: 30S ribosomal protein S20 [Saccharofermentanales bacterium]